jgi:hypothetical protein
MVKSSPEKLAAALRANLKRRKEQPAAKDPKKVPDSTLQALEGGPQKPPKKSA